MTKAERIFTDTYKHCKITLRCQINLNGVNFNTNFDGAPVGFSYLSTHEVTCKRTWNAIQKLIDKEKSHLEFDFKHNFIDTKTFAFRMRALEMVQSTLNNTIRSWSI